MHQKINFQMHKKDKEERQKISDKVIHNLSSSSGRIYINMVLQYTQSRKEFHTSLHSFHDSIFHFSKIFYSKNTVTN